MVGDHDEALQYSEPRHHRAPRNKRPTSPALLTLRPCQRGRRPLGRAKEARTLFIDLHDLAVQQGYPAIDALTLGYLAEYELDWGEPGDALRHAQEGMATLTEVDAPSTLEASLRLTLGHAMLANDLPIEPVRTLFLEALPYASRARSPL